MGGGGPANPSLGATQGLRPTLGCRLAYGSCSLAFGSLRTGATATWREVSAGPPLKRRQLKFEWFGAPLVAAGAAHFFAD